MKSGTIELVQFPPEIIYAIIKSAIKTKYTSIQQIRLTCHLLNQLAEDISIHLMNNHWSNLYLGIKAYKAKETHATRFFKIMRHDTASLSLSEKFLSRNEAIEAHEFRRHQPEATESVSELFFLRSNVAKMASKQLDQIGFDLMTIPHNIPILPALLDVYVISAVRARSYNALRMLLKRVKTHKSRIAIDRIIDEIFLQAAKEYTGEEFERLRLAVSIDINRPLGHFVSGGEPIAFTYLYHPIIFQAVIFRNLHLIKYLVEQGADISQPDAVTGMSIVGILSSQLVYNACLIDQDREMLQTIYDYLRSHLAASQVTSSVVQAKAQ